MEKIRVITVLCVILSLVTLSHSAAQEVLGKKASYDDQGTDDKQQIMFPGYPRKLKLINGVATAEKNAHNTHPTAVNKQEETTSGNHHHRGGELRRHGRKGTRQEWMEGTHTSEFYTMDYHLVRRSRPIHNKSIPFRHP